MGICQTVGGASTSGHGISGAQVAHAIRVGASLHNGGDGPFHTFESMPATAFSAQATQTTQYEPPGGGKTEDELNNADIKVTSYAPRVFQHLRMLEGVGDQQFEGEWDLPEEKCDMQLGEGRSMALFLRSKNLDFMCKTISEVEVNVLMDILPKYAEHLRSNQNSLLMRFTMLLKVEIGQSIGFILCFGDLFSTCTHLNERWDIKGRVPKPGKYRHFPNHASSEKPHPCTMATGSPFAQASDGQSSGELKQRRSSVFAEVTEYDNAEEENEPHSPSSNALITRKDKDLTRLFWVAEPTRTQLLDQLHSDYAFLHNAGLMDYSILIGVKYDKCGGDTASMMRRRRMLGEAAAGEQEKRVVRGGSCQHISRCEYHNGVSSIGHQETYYIGIIDMLTVYNVKKKSANFFKSFLWRPPTLSTIPPADYRKRIDGFTDLIFPPLEKKKDTL